LRPGLYETLILKRQEERGEEGRGGERRERDLAYAFLLGTT
jgi:hypothetical protein